MARIKKTKLSESVINAIKEMIAQGDYAPGDKFHSEHQLAKELGVSRSSIREAMRILEVTGQVTVLQGKGIFIADPGAQAMNSFAAWLKANCQSIMDHFEVRLIMEPMAAGKAAQMGTPQDLQAMEQALKEFDEHAAENDIPATIQCDREFHRLLSKATQNETLHYLMQCMTTSLPDGWITSLFTPGRIEKTKREHHRIIEAIRRKSPEQAREEMAAHLENAIRDIKALHR